MNSIDPADDVAVQIRFWSTIVSLPGVWIPLAVGSVILLSGYPTWLGAACLGVGATVAAAVVFTQSEKYKTLAKEDLRHAPK